MCIFYLLMKQKIIEYDGLGGLSFDLNIVTVRETMSTLKREHRNDSSNPHGQNNTIRSYCRVPWLWPARPTSGLSVYGIKYTTIKESGVLLTSAE